MTARYPENQMMYGDTTEQAAQEQQLAQSYAKFADLRESILLDYTYNTARAYWGDLDHIWWWATERGKDIFTLTDADIRQYKALLRRRKYSENTIRRRMVVWGKWQKVVREVSVTAATPASSGQGLDTWVSPPR